MARPNRTPERRRELLPTLAETFGELGYRRTTTAELAERCGVQEPVLYRLWPGKQAMFVAALDFVADRSEEIWTKLLEDGKGSGTSAERILAYEATHHGELGLYRIIFAGLSETDDPEIAEALRGLYGRFHGFIAGQVESHRDARKAAALPDAALTAWAIVGLGTVANIGRETGLLTVRGRARLFREVGAALLGPAAKTPKKPRSS